MNHLIRRVIILALLIGRIASTGVVDQTQITIGKNKDYDSYTTEAVATQLHDICQSPLPGFVPGVFFSPLDTPPDDSVNWINWFYDNADEIIAIDDDHFLIIPTTTEQEKMQDDETDAFGGNVNQLTFKTGDEFRYALSIQNGAINLIHLQRLDGSSIQKSLDELGTFIGRTVAVTDFYIAQPGAGSYGWHFDDDDGFIYLVEGSKRFRVAGKEVGSETIIDVVLQPGDSIFIPAGYYHYGCGGDEQSIIWSIGLGIDNDAHKADYEALELKADSDYELLKNDTWEGIASKRRLLGVTV